MSNFADAFLADLEAQALPASLPSRPEIQRVRYTHDAMIDLIVQSPEISQNELAALFGFTPAWVSIIINSDAFQARLAERREELIDPRIRVTLREKLQAVADRSLTVLTEKLAGPATTISDGLALRAAELGIKGLGLGQPQAPAAPAADHLAELAQRLVALRRKTYDQEGNEVG